MMTHIYDITISFCYMNAKSFAIWMQNVESSYLAKLMINDLGGEC